MRSGCVRVAAILILSLVSCCSFAQAKKASASAVPSAAKAPVDPLVAAMLVKSAVMALQHANQTGNYSVLCELGTPVFRERFNPAKLTEVFANLRRRDINLNPVLMLDPKFTKGPEFNEQNQLHIAGNFPTLPLQIQYEVLYTMVDGKWRLDGLAVDAVPEKGAVQGTPSPTQPSGPSAVGKHTDNARN